jgi:hypothetical protein
MFIHRQIDCARPALGQTDLTLREAGEYPRNFNGFVPVSANQSECTNGLDLSPIVLEGRKSLSRSWDKPDVFLNQKLHAKERWTMAQNDLVVVGR